MMTEMRAVASLRDFFLVGGAVACGEVGEL